MKRIFVDYDGNPAEGDLTTLVLAQPGTRAAFADPTMPDGIFWQPVVGYVQMVAKDEEAGFEIVTWLPVVCREGSGLSAVSIADSDEGRSDYLGIALAGESIDRIVAHLEQRLEEEDDGDLSDEEEELVE